MCNQQLYFFLNEKNILLHKSRSRLFILLKKKKNRDNMIEKKLI